MRTSAVCLLGALHSFFLFGSPLHAQQLEDDFQPESHKNWHLLPPKDKCGKPAETKIYGGYEPVLGSFPWIARIGYTGSGGMINYGCAGSLISDYYVLTAAHCISGALVSVRLGEHDARKNPDCQESEGVNVCAPPVQDIPVTRFVSHENYLKPSKHFDVALLRLRSPPKFSNFVSPICLIDGDCMKKDFANENSIAAGWGKTESSSHPTLLNAVSMKVWNQDKCVAVYQHKDNGTSKDGKAPALKDCEDKYALSQFRNGTSKGPLRVAILKSQMCAGGKKGKDTCSGDSGGPLMWTGSFDRTYLIGLTSYGPTPCGISRPGVYSRISSFMRWILDHMEE